MPPKSTRPQVSKHQKYKIRDKTSDLVTAELAVWVGNGFRGVLEALTCASYGGSQSERRSISGTVAAAALTVVLDSVAWATQKRSDH